jgi:nitrogen fixation protein FixH
MKLLESGKLWPYAVGIAITCVFCFGVITVIVTGKADTQISDDYMTNYQDADVNANDLINARIAFDKKYKLKYLTNHITENGCDIKYKLTNLNNEAVPGAEMILAISRPETEIYNKKIKGAVFENGEYIFKDIKFPKTGVWNLLLRVDIKGNNRFFPIKADTRPGHDNNITEAKTY